MGRENHPTEYRLKMAAYGRTEKLNLAYRWFCRLSISDAVPDHSTLSKNRHGRFREAEAFRFVFEQVLSGSPAIAEYLEALQIDDTPTPTPPKKISQTDPAARWTAAPGGPAFYAYSTNYLIDTDNGIIVDVEATPTHRKQEVWSTKVMIERVKDHFGLETKKLIGDTAYGRAEFLGWTVNEKGIEPHVPAWDPLNGTNMSKMTRPTH